MELVKCLWKRLGTELVKQGANYSDAVRSKSGGNPAGGSECGEVYCQQHVHVIFTKAL